MSDDHKYILSPQFTIPTAEQLFSEVENNGSKVVNEEVEKIKNNEAYILANASGAQFLINPTIKLFLDAFLQPTTLTEVINSFAEQAKTIPEKITPVMDTFFQRLVSKKILVSEKDAVSVQSIVDNETFVKPKHVIGDQIDAYKVIKEISIRKTTQLYLGQKNDSDELGIIKMLILPEELPADQKKKNLLKFKQEFNLMSELPPHPNICKLLDYNDAENYAILEYIEGKSLKRTIDAGSIGINKRLEIIHQMLKAIAFVQKQDIVHGDIHLSNFLIDTNSQLKLIDFGLSNHITPDENEIIRNGAVYECVPPERAKEIGGFGFLKKTSDFRSEVFQLGVVMYFLLYGNYPFSGFTWNKLAKSIVHDELNYAEQTNEQDTIPPYILELLRISLQKDPLKRFENAHDMVLSFEKKKAIKTLH